MANYTIKYAGGRKSETHGSLVSELNPAQAHYTGLDSCQHREQTTRLVPGGASAIEIAECKHCGATKRRPVGTSVSTGEWSGPTMRAAEALGFAPAYLAQVQS